MEDQFLNCTQSLALKELGFNKPCFAYYSINNIENKLFYDIDLDVGELTALNQNQFYHNNLSEVGRISSPLKQQVFRWFRNKYKYSSEIKTPDGIDGKWRNTIHKIYGFGNYSNDDNEYNSYEEAEEAAIDTLIKLVKDDLERSN